MAWSVAANIRQRGHGTSGRSGNSSRERKQQETEQQNLSYQQRMGATPPGYQQHPKGSPQRQHSKASLGTADSRERSRRSPPTQPRDEGHGRVKKVSRGSPVRMNRLSPPGTDQPQMSRSLPHEYMRHFPQDARRRQDEHAQSARRSPGEHRRRHRVQEAADAEADPRRRKTSSPDKLPSRQPQGDDGERRHRKSYT